jgi:hypothetical protein
MPDDSTHILINRLETIANEIDLGMDCSVRIGIDEPRVFVQIQCYRRDVITGEMGYGFGGKAWPSEYSTQNEIIQMIFGLYLRYWEHEARETFSWRGRRIFGPHIASEALWEIARRVDVRSAKHVEDSRGDDWHIDMGVRVHDQELTAERVDGS